MTQPVLHTRNLTKVFGKYTALDNLNISIHQGEVFCLMGANGAGKTTTINLFLNFITPTSGEAFVGGKNVVDYSLATKAELAYIPETVTLYGHLSGYENLKFFVALAGLGKLTRSDLHSILKRAHFPLEAADNKLNTYSKGMRQKIAIAIALAKEAKAFLFDEPTSGLDPAASNEFSVLLEKLRDSGAAILMTTHDLFRAKESGTRLGIMKYGKLIETLQAENVGHADLENIYLRHMHD
ncbi:putative ABC transporter ATP-binding protein YbhF [Gimesia maris]|uniref:ABC transporter ATP-binding protein n=1 Tax=Gimesia maris TaxID=122 RepID=UPI0011899504|nr:ABC transporter ATP-binding protein [Gimesia maris]QDU16182.1 putative ABC transporter ATP-binding protein YbhF [Gimesia maris]